MNEQELKEWFWNKYNSCYVVKHNDYIDSDFLYYDENFARTKKLAEVLDIEMVYPDKPNGKCLFEIDRIYNYLYIDRDDIWSVFEKKLSSYEYKEIKSLIRNWLCECDKTIDLIPASDVISEYNTLREHDKLKVFNNSDN